MPTMPLILIPAPSSPDIPPRVWERIDKDVHEHRMKQEARVKEFGHVREPVHVPDYRGYRIVAVRNRIYYSKKWRFFADFLMEYGRLRFGQEWFEAQNATALENQHPIHIWRRQAYEFISRQPRTADGAIVTTPNGPVAACNNFYYDLYTVDDNSLLDETLLSRLKHRGQFQGAMHELFAEATCLRAGFTITRENERDGTRKHVEFMAVHKATGQHVLVEAKSRHRAGVIAQAGERDTSPDMKFRRLINDAVAKDPNNPLALFVDTNLPPERAGQFYEPQSIDPVTPSRAMAALIERVRKDYGDVDPYNLLIFSNHPQYYSEDGRIAAPNRMAAFLSPKKTRVPVFHQQALHDLLTATNLYGNVPNTFPAARQ
jgi:hypothetical protein